MAQSKGHLLLLSLLLVLSFAQLALAHYTWHSAEDDWYNKFRKPKASSGKKLYKGKYAGFYSGKPSYDSNGQASYGGSYHKKPLKMSPISKPYYKYRPSYSLEAVYKAKPIYTKPSVYKNKPTYSPKPVYKPKPIYTKPIYSPKPVYKPKPIYTKPTYTKPIYKKPSPQAPSPYKKPQKPHSYYKQPVPYYMPRQSPAPTVPLTPSYTRPASSSQQKWLDPHNAARAEVGLPPMVWNDEVAHYAQSWANQRLARGCGLEHSGGPYGENIFWGSGGGYGPAECVAAWVSEKQYYNYADNSCSGGDCGHYTQIIWANSVRLGCAKVQCDSGNVFMTCNYDPPGNYVGTRPY